MTLDTQNENLLNQFNIDSISKNLTSNLDAVIKSAKNKLIEQQHENGHWVYELEADCTIPAEYILMNHFTGEIDSKTEEKIAEYLRTQQNEEGGWSLYTGGNFDLSCSVKAYYALKLAGDNQNNEHMVRAKTMILNH